MRVDKVDPVKGIGIMKFNTDTEMDLVAESMDRLIQKQQKLVEKMGGRGRTRHKDIDEVEKLERFKKSKDRVVEIPRQNKMRLKKMREKIKTKHEQHNKKMMAIGKPDKVVDDVEDTQEFKNMAKVIADSEKNNEGSGFGEGSEVTHRNMHVLVNALNEHIWDMEKDGLHKKTRRNEQKYEKLKQMLDNAQEQKSKFERVREKPRGYGRLRK